jgi:hypothetical protein
VQRRGKDGFIHSMTSPWNRIFSRQAAKPAKFGHFFFSLLCAFAEIIQH